VSVFESGHAEYVIPEQLYLWRLRCLEDALRRRANDPCGLKVLATYVPQDKGEDPGFAEYDAEIIRYSEADEVGDEQLNKSAFESLLISWVDGDDHSEEPLSPWEVTLPDQAFNTPTPPPLALSEKRALAKALRNLECDDTFKAFLGPVDVRRYPDYLARVEVPMDIGMIKERLGQDYYVSTLSVLSDIKLIRDNCLKYNGPDEIGLLAVQLHVTFREILKEELANLGVAANIIAELDVDTDVVIRPNLALPHSEHQGPRTRSSGAATISSLELLPPPASMPALRSTRTTARNSPALETPASLLRGRASARSERVSNSAGRSVIGGDEFDPNSSTSRTTRHSLRSSGGGVTPDSRGFPIRENGNSALPNRSTNSTRGRRQGDAEINRHDRIRQTERPSRPLRSNRSKRRIRYDQDDDDDDDDDDDGEIEEEYEVHAESDDFSAEEDEEMDDEDEEEDSVQVNSSRRPRRASAQRRSVLEAALNSDSPRRQSPRSKAATKHQDDEFDVDMSEEVAESKTATRRRVRNNAQAVGEKPSPRRRQVLKTKGKPKNDDVDSEDVEEDPFNSRREGTRTRKASSHPSPESPPARRQRQTRSSKSYQEEDSDHHVDEEDEDEAVTPQLRKSANGRKGRSQEAPKASPASGSKPSRRSRASTSKSYKELDSEELEESDSEELEESDSDDVLAPSRSRSRTGGRGASKRSANVNGKIAEPATKRSRVTARGKLVKLPELAPWPHVPLKKITVVAEGVLEKMRLLDSEKGAFEIPVAEAFPGIETAYRRTVTSPMDFRTIEEERLPTYESISQLQDDLMLVFGNCVRFNGEDTEYGRYAMMMLEQLGDVFQSVCLQNRVRIPAGWNQL
jgi:hypothetical protein